MTPKEELESKITAMLLGELPEQEAAALRLSIAADPELSNLHDRLKLAIDLVRETVAAPADEPAPPVDAPKLSQERREQLFEAFKVVRPKELRRAKRIQVDVRTWGALAAMLAGLLVVAGLMFKFRRGSVMPGADLALSVMDSDSETHNKSYWAKSEVSPKRPSDSTPSVSAAIQSPPPVLYTYSEPASSARPAQSSPATTIAKGSYGETAKPAEPSQTVNGRGDYTFNLSPAPQPAQDRNGDGMVSGVAPASRGTRVVLPAGATEDFIVNADVGDPKAQWFGASDGSTLALEKQPQDRWASKSSSGFGLGASAGGGGFGVEKPAPAEKSIKDLEEFSEYQKMEGKKEMAGSVGGFGGRGASRPVAVANPTPALPPAVSPPPTAAPEGIATVEALVKGAKTSGGDSRENFNDSGFAGFDSINAAGVPPTITVRPAPPAPQSAPVLIGGEFAPAEKSAKADSFGNQLITGKGLLGANVSRPAVEPAGGARSGRSPAPSGAPGLEVRFDINDDVIGKPGAIPTKPQAAGGAQISDLAGEQKQGGIDTPLVNSFTLPAADSVSTGLPASAGTVAHYSMDGAMVSGGQFEAYNGVVLMTNATLGSTFTMDASGQQGIDALGFYLNGGLGFGGNAQNDRSSIRSRLGAIVNRAASSDSDSGGVEAGKRVEIALPQLAQNEWGREAGGGSERRRTDSKPLSETRPLPAQASASEETKLAREVENLKQVQEKLNMRITQEEVELALPRSSIVQVIDQAEPEPAKSETLWGRLKGALGSEPVSVVRLKVERDASDIGGGLKANLGGGQGFDPYWVQDQVQTIKSKSVLSKVADELKLNETWAEKKGGGRTLSPEETYQLLKQKVEVRQQKDSSLMDIRVKSEDPQEAARIANTIAKVYQDFRLEARRDNSQRGIETLRQQLAERDKKLGETKEKLERLKQEQAPEQVTPSKPLAAGAAIPQPEVQTVDNAFSTFSLNVSDVSFKLAAASLEKGVMPDAASVRSEEFINAFDYRDPEPTGSAPIAFAWERSRYPFAHDRDLLRFSVKTASSGRVASQPLNLVLLLDNSGSMERADRVSIRMECLRVLASQLKPQDRVSVVAFARTARLWVDGLPGNQAAELPQRVGNLSPEGGTNLEEAMNLAYQTALKHYLANGANRVVLLTDGAANLGDVKPESLKAKVEANRKQGIALDCFGIGWDGYNDDLLEVLSRNGDGRYGFVNTPEAASTEFAAQLAGALKVAASDVKVQVEWNPRRVTAYRQIGYAKHQLKKEQFRDNTVDAAEIGAAEAGNALYAVQVNPAGEGPLGTVRVRFKVPGTTDYREHAWEVPYSGAAKTLEQSSAAVRLAATASAFSEWLVSSPYAAEVTPDGLLGYLRGVPESCGADPRPKKLEWMIRQAKSLSGK